MPPTSAKLWATRGAFMGLVLDENDPVARPATDGSAPAAATPGHLDVPVAESGKAIPVLFGTRVVNQPNVVWYGDVKTTEIRQSSGSGGKK